MISTSRGVSSCLFFGLSSNRLQPASSSSSTQYPPLQTEGMLFNSISGGEALSTTPRAPSRNDGSPREDFFHIAVTALCYSLSCCLNRFRAQPDRPEPE